MRNAGPTAATGYNSHQNPRLLQCTIAFGEASPECVLPTGYVLDER
jgi:hypothetical protein